MNDPLIENTAGSSSHPDTAQTCVEQLRALRQLIPNFTVPTLKSGSRGLAAAASVPPELVELTLVAVRNCAALVRGGAIDAAQTRDLQAYAAAFGPVADELEAMAYFVRHSIAAAKNKVGSDALTTYALAQRLAKRPETADLAPVVADMRRLLGKTRKGTKEAQPVPTVPPDPKPVPR
ncbi:MAG TPA: hypothetical protein VFV49_09230 [Thermoanaerobaculia bacterium]|nr:hypothetical protein [Thermoanaerobaculia bacterium]